MSSTSKIEWTDATWNPVRGCTKVSPGCAHCYAERIAERFRGVPGSAYEQGFDLKLVPEKLIDPVTWSKPRRIFVNSMSDLFHENIPEPYIKTVMRIMQVAYWHTFQVLTKRSERMAVLLNGKMAWAAELENVWWGVSVENLRHGQPRVAHLSSVPSDNLFISYEPLLEDTPGLDLRRIAWAIVGGESGPGARPMEKVWALNILDDCRRNDVAFFFKQWGGVNKKKNGRLLDGKTYDEMPEFRKSEPPSIAKRQQLVKDCRAFTGLDLGLLSELGV